MTTLTRRTQSDCEWYASQICVRDFEHDWVRNRDQAYVKKGRERNWKETTEELLSNDGSTRDMYNMFLENGGWAAYPTAVVFRVDVRDLSNIDTVRGTFMASMWAAAEYYCADHLTASATPEAPRINVRNSVSSEKVIRDSAQVEEIDTDLSSSRGGKAFRSYAWILNEEFSETFELQQFPFDVQDCTVYFALLAQHRLHPDAQPWFWVPVSGLITLRSTLSEWELLRPKIQVWDATADKPVLAFRMRVKRRWQWYVTNHMVVVGVLSTMTFSVFALEPDALPDRLSITFTLLLTATAAKFVLADSLPRISYLTFLDGYILACFFLILVVSLENILVAVLADQGQGSLADTIDSWGLLVIGGPWVLLHLAIIWRIRARLTQIRQRYGDPWPQQPLNIPVAALENESSQLQPIW